MSLIRTSSGFGSAAAEVTSTVRDAEAGERVAEDISATTGAIFTNLRRHTGGLGSG